MDTLQAKLRCNSMHSVANPVKFHYDDADVEIYNTGKWLYMNLTGETDLEELFFSILSLIFIYHGSFPTIHKVEINGVSEDVSQYNSLFFTSSHFQNDCFKLCDINKNTINEHIIAEYLKLPVYAIRSLQALVCTAYEKVMSDHKITLMLHVIDGLISDEEGKSIEEDIKSQLMPSSYSKGKCSYAFKAYFLFNDNFFVYDNKSQILPVLRTDSIKFIRTITDTRNHNTHFTAPKSNNLKIGVDNMIYLTLIYYTLRVYVIKKLGISLTDDMVTDGLCSIQLWIFEIMQRNYSKSGNIET